MGEHREGAPGVRRVHLNTQAPLPSGFRAWRGLARADQRRPAGFAFQQRAKKRWKVLAVALWLTFHPARPAFAGREIPL
jgi:hypothetical protein